MTEPYTLTAPGWPRPVVGGYPIPWVAPAEKLSEVNEGRRLASVGGSVCQVCGLSFEYGADAWAFVRVPDVVQLTLESGGYLGSVLGSPRRVIPLDGAVLHEKCAALTAARCPHVRDATDLICVAVPANDADPMSDLDGTLRPSYAAGDCRYVPWPVPR